MRITPLFAVLLVAGAAGSSDARPTKIALTKVDGDTSGVGKAVTDALDDTDLDIVSARQVNFTLSKLGLDGKLADADVERLAAALEVDAIVRSAYDRRERKMRFTIFANGQKGKPFTVQVGNAQSAKFRTLIRTTMVAKLAAVVPLDVEDPAATKAVAAPAPPAPDDKAAKARPGAATAATTRVALAGSASAPTKITPPGKKPDVAVAEADAAKTKTKAKAKPTGKADAVAEGPVTSPSGKATKPPTVAEAPVASPPSKPVVAEAPPPVAKPAEVAAESPAVVASAQPQKLAAAKDPSDTGAVFAAAKEYQPESGAATQRAVTQVATRDDEVAAAPAVRAQFEPTRPASPHSANFVAVRADLGVSVAQRNLQFQTTGVAGTPKNFTDNPVPGARFAGELYPFAFGDPHSGLAGLGIAGEVDQTMPFNLATAEAGVQLKGTERHYSIGLRYRIAFGHTETSPTLTLGAGYAAQTYTADRTGLAAATSFDVPDVDYRMFDPGLAFRLPLGRRFAFTLEGRGLLVISAGAIQNPDQYGTTKLYGGAGAAGLELILGNRIAVRLAAEAKLLSLQFDGNGALSNNRDGNPMTVDVSQALDSYFGGSATIAVMY